MNVLHLLAGGDIGGIETLMSNYARYSENRNHFIMLWGENGSATNQIRSEGSPVIELKLHRGKELSSFKFVKDYCKENKIDVAIVHHAAPLAHLYLIGIKRMYPNIKIVTYAHGAAEDMSRKEKKQGLWLRKKILSKSLQKADAVVAISDCVKKSLVDYFGTPIDNIHIIFNGTPLSIYQNLCGHIDSNTIRLIYVGRLIEQKGVQLTLKALSKMKTNKKWKFVIIGDGSYRQELETMSKDLGLETYVEFLGKRTDIPQQLNNADIFVHFPLWREGFGITIIEAMAVGLVCICANVGAIPEIVTDGINGFLVEYRDTDALADALADALERYNTSEVRRIKLSAKERAKNFSIEKFVRQLDELISSLGNFEKNRK